MAGYETFEEFREAIRVAREENLAALDRLAASEAAEITSDDRGSKPSSRIGSPDGPE